MERGAGATFGSQIKISSSCGSWTNWCDCGVLQNVFWHHTPQWEVPACQDIALHGLQFAKSCRTYAQPYHLGSRPLKLSQLVPRADLMPKFVHTIIARHASVVTLCHCTVGERDRRCVCVCVCFVNGAPLCNLSCYDMTSCKSEWTHMDRKTCAVPAIGPAWPSYSSTNSSFLLPQFPAVRFSSAFSSLVFILNTTAHDLLP